MKYYLTILALILIILSLWYFHSPKSVKLGDVSGANSPSTTVDDATVGTIAWTNANNAQVSDGVYATATAPFNTSLTSTHYLKATNFGFAIPTSATINGILVQVQAKADFNYSSAGISVVWTQLLNHASFRIVQGGVIGLTEMSTNSYGAVGTTPAYFSIPNSGASTNLWGQSWSAADINSSGFGVAISLGIIDTESTKSPQVASIDNIRITVYYTVGNTQQEQIRSGSVKIQSGRLILK